MTKQNSQLSESSEKILDDRLQYLIDITCSECNGAGVLYDMSQEHERCFKCGGLGVINNKVNKYKNEN